MDYRVVPESILEEARAPVVRRIQRDAKVLVRTGGGQLVLEHMAANLTTEDISVGVFWKADGVSSTVRKELALDLKTAPGSYFNDRRLEVCARLLLDERLQEYSCGDIAASAGYTRRYSTFGDQFKKWSEQVPVTFRKEPNPEILERLRELDDLMEEESGKWTRPPRGFAVARPAQETAGHLLQASREAVADRRLDDALREVEQALQVIAEHGLADLEHEAHAEAAVAYQWRAGRCIQRFHVEEAWGDVVQAGIHYASAGRLAPRIETIRRLAFAPPDPRDALLNNLCGRCGTRLLDDTDLVAALDDVLQPIPLDLPFFQQACDHCYAELWRNVHRARLGLEPNAWRAAFLADYCDDPYDEDAEPCVGIYIHLLEAIERSAFQDQKRRVQLARRAYQFGRDMKHRERESLGRLFYANVLRAKGDLAEAERELQAAEGGCENPWLEAYRLRVQGLLKLSLKELDAAIDALLAAASFYENLDPHGAGMMQMNAGIACREAHLYPEALQAFEASVNLVDPRRDPLTANALLPINVAAVLNSLQRYDEVDEVLDRCDYDRAAHPSLHAMELLNRSAATLGRGDAAGALPGFQHARELCEGTSQKFYAALVSLYSLEAHADLGDRLRAVENCATALKAFQEAGCDVKTRQAMERLSELLAPLQTDAAAVRACVRRLARRHGGVLPIADEDARD